MKRFMFLITLVVGLDFDASQCYGTCPVSTPHGSCVTSDPLALVSVVSKKIHGTLPTDPTFEIPLYPIAHTECRQGPNYTIVFTFSHALEAVANVRIWGGTATVDSYQRSGTECIVNLAGVPLSANPQTFIVSLGGVHDSRDYINVSVPVKILVGDSTDSSDVNASDVTQIKFQSGMSVSATNFRTDVTANGSINASDVNLAKTNSGTATQPEPAPLSRLAICEDNRFICAGSSGQFFWLGDTCWWLMNATDDEVTSYLSKRAQQQFTGIQMMALMLKLPTTVPEEQLQCATDRYGNSPTDDDGNLDPLCPNSAYWARFKWIIDEAQRKGLYVGVFLVHGTETGQYFHGSNGAAYAFGRDLAQLLHNNTNVWYSVAIEYDYGGTPFAIYDNLANGIRYDADHHDPENPIHPIIGIHPSGVSTTVAQFGSSPPAWLDVHMLQSGHQFEHEEWNGITYKQTDHWIEEGYNISSFKPIFDGEPIYENIVDDVWHDPNANENTRRADASVVRFKAYEAVFAGAFGHTYAHENSDYLWTFNGDNHAQPYTRNIHWRVAANIDSDTPVHGGQQLRYLRELIECHSQNRKPDQALIGETSTPDYPHLGLTHKRATREKFSDPNQPGKYTLVYLPQGGRDNLDDRTVTVDMTKIVSPSTAVAKWFNPETGLYEGSPITGLDPNSQTFTANVKTSTAFVKDWVLVIESATFPGCNP